VSGLVRQEPSGCVRVLTSAGYTGRPRVPAVECGEFSYSGNKDDAWQRLWRALDKAFGGLPPDLEAEPLIMRGNPGPVLVGTASRNGDTLVVGAGRRGTFGRLRRGQVGRYCLAHADCPVIAIPSPALNRAGVRAVRARAARAFRT